MHFAENKYTNWYFNIIRNAVTRDTLECYTENHHIIPKSLGGVDSYDNLAILSAREHFICHWLLTKMTTAENHKHKMIFAFKMMMHMKNSNQKRYKIGSHLYQILRENLRDKLSTVKFSAERINNMKKAAKIRAENLSDLERKTRSTCLTKLNKNRKGEERPYAKGNNNNMFNPGVLEKVTGENNHFYNKKHSIETKHIIGECRKKEKWKCQHCEKEGIGFGNYNRWHNDNCKEKINA